MQWEFCLVAAHGPSFFREERDEAKDLGRLGHGEGRKSLRSASGVVVEPGADPQLWALLQA